MLLYRRARLAAHARQARCDRLQANWASPTADLARIHGPIGLAIGAVSPAEIAVSILAQMTQVLRRGEKTPRAALDRQSARDRPWPPPEDRRRIPAVIYADPPWTFATYSRKGKGRSAEAHYDCMSLADIKALPVAEWAAPDCVLLLWATDPLLDKAMDVIRAWGFTYKTVGFCWAKLNKSAPGLFTASAISLPASASGRAPTRNCACWRHRGHPQRRSRAVRKLIVSPRREHSRKPEEAYERIEALCEGPYLELFARARRPGWDGWGDQSEAFADGELPARRWRANSYPGAADAPT